MTLVQCCSPEKMGKDEEEAPTSAHVPFQSPSRLQPKKVNDPQRQRPNVSGPAKSRKEDCMACGASFKSYKGLANHTRRVQSCKSVLMEQFKTSPHVSQDPKRPYACPACPARYRSRSRLRSHDLKSHRGVYVMQTTKKPRPTPCMRCHKTFANDGAFRHHVSRVHSSGAAGNVVATTRVQKNNGPHRNLLVHARARVPGRLFFGRRWPAY